MGISCYFSVFYRHMHKLYSFLYLNILSFVHVIIYIWRNLHFNSWVLVSVNVNLISFFHLFYIPNIHIECVPACLRASVVCHSATLWTVALQAPLSTGFSRQEYWSGLPCPPPGDLPDSGIEPAVLTSCALAGRLFTTSATWKSITCIIMHICNMHIYMAVLFSRLVMSDSLRPHKLQHARLPCPSPTPGVHPNPGPLSWWSHLTISSSVVPFSSCLNLSQHQSLFKWVNSSHQVAKVLEFQLQHQSFQWTPRTDLL